MMEQRMITIPSELLAIRELARLEQWMLVRERESPQTMFKELEAHNALKTERFVRKNVSRRRFLIWKQQNPRFFTTEREMQHLMREAPPAKA